MTSSLESPMPAPIPPWCACFAGISLLLVTVLSSAPALAQGGGGDDTVPTPVGDVPVSPGSGNTVNTTTYTPPVGFPPPGADLNPGLPSSSKPVNDTSRSHDSFDLNRGMSGGGSSVGMRGSRNDLGLIRRPLSVPSVHRVRRGETLSIISGHYFKNPYQWPKVWSYNPQIMNPHWIYPGDQVRLRLGPENAQSAVSGRLSGNRSLVPKDTVFLRHVGWIGDAEQDTWGQVTGSREEQMLLGDYNTVYLQIKPKVEIRIGQRLTVFRESRRARSPANSRQPPGEIVRVFGTVRVNRWDPDKRVARCEVIESLDSIERGFRVGPVGRRFDIVPPRRNSNNLEARVIDSIQPLVLLGQQQVVFIDKGTEDGLKPGNRLKAVRRGDAWRRTLKTATSAVRDRMRQDIPENAKYERAPLIGDDQDLPDEPIAEIRILRTQKYSSIAIVTEARREVAIGDRLVATKGY